MAQDVHQAIAHGLAEELARPPGHKWIAYRQNGTGFNPGHWIVELLAQPPTPKHGAHTVLRLILEEDAIFTSNPRTMTRARFDYYDPQIVEAIDQLARNILILVGKPN